MNGTTERALNVEFPAMPAGHYDIILHFALEPGWGRGYVQTSAAFASKPKKFWRKSMAADLYKRRSSGYVHEDYSLLPQSALPPDLLLQLEYPEM